MQRQFTLRIGRGVCFRWLFFLCNNAILLRKNNQRKHTPRPISNVNNDLFIYLFIIIIIIIFIFYKLLDRLTRNFCECVFVSEFHLYRSVLLYGHRDRTVPTIRDGGSQDVHLDFHTDPEL